MGVGQRGGTASKKQLLMAWMWKDRAVGSAGLQEKAERVGAVAEGEERQPGREEQSGKGMRADFLGANLMGFLPEGRVAKVHPAQTSCLTRVQVWEGPLSLA